MLNEHESTSFIKNEFNHAQNHRNRKVVTIENAELCIDILEIYFI